MKPIPVFVGYDPREAVAYHVCVNSIIRHASQPVAIVPVALNLFQDYDETHTDGSNHFIYTRFLVPHLMDYHGWAIFIDDNRVARILAPEGQGLAVELLAADDQGPRQSRCALGGRLHLAGSGDEVAPVVREVVRPEPSDSAVEAAALVAPAWSSPTTVTG